MKNKLSSVFNMWFGCVLSLLATLAMFLPTMIADFCGESASRMATSYFWSSFNDVGGRGSWPSFIGYMLILVAGLLLGVMALIPEPSAKSEKIVLISCIFCLIIGMVLVGLLQPIYNGFNNNDNALSYYLPGWYITMVFAFVAMIMTFVAIKKDF